MCRILTRACSNDHWKRDEFLGSESHSGFSINGKLFSDAHLLLLILAALGPLQPPNATCIFAFSPFSFLDDKTNIRTSQTAKVSLLNIAVLASTAIGLTRCSKSGFALPASMKQS